MKICSSRSAYEDIDRDCSSSFILKRLIIRLQQNEVKNFRVINCAIMERKNTDFKIFVVKTYFLWTTYQIEVILLRSWCRHFFTDRSWILLEIDFIDELQDIFNMICFNHVAQIRFCDLKHVYAETHGPQTKKPIATSTIWTYKTWSSCFWPNV